MIATGKLDRRVQFLRANSFFDGLQNRIGDFEKLGDPVWAAKFEVKDTEKFQAGGIGADVQARFAVRHSSFTASITTLDRLVCDGRDYGIAGIKEIGRREGIEFTATLSGAGAR